MKTKLTFVLSFLLSVVMSSASLPAVAAGGEPTAKTITEAELHTAILDLKGRVKLLREARRNASSRAEKKQIRAEIRDIKKEARALKQQADGGLLIGIGIGVLLALVLVLLLQ